MSGRAYSMKELRGIVEYLVEHKLYAEIKGRKMWMDFAASGQTSRTWQSLKETFLKRILPDIYNPYYKLSMDTIRSFREGREVAKKSRNKLEIRESSDTTEIEADEEKPSTSTHDRENGTGEDKICSKVASNRESTETVILETNEDQDNNNEDPSAKEDDPADHNTRTTSLRDCITFTEPLTPMLQEILHDFDSDDDDEVQLVIDEVVDKNKGDEDVQESQSIIQMKKNEKARNELISDLMDDNTNGAEVSQEESHLAVKASKATTKLAESPTKENAKTETKKLRSSKANEDTITSSEEVLKNNGPITSSDEFVKTKEPKPTKNHSKNSKSIPKDNKKNLRNRKSASTEDNQVTTLDVVKSLDTASSVIDSQLPNNQEGLLHTEKEVLPTTSKKRTSSESSPKSAEKSRKKFKTSLKKNKELESNADKTNEEESKQHNDNDKMELLVSEKANKLSVAEESQANEVPMEKKTEVPEIIVTEPNKDKDGVTNVNNDESVNNVEENEQTQHVSESQPLSNPCLHSVSLFEDNLPNATSSDSDVLLANISRMKNKSKLKNQNVFLISNSDSEPELDSNKKSKIKSKKKKIMDYLFDKNDDAVTRKKGRRNSQFNGGHNNIVHISSDESEWTSESDNEFVSGPRSKNRYSRKYMKPRSSRLLALQQKGCLFVTCGKKIYPVIEDNKTSKNFLTYIPEEESEDEEAAYWKLKYVEERKKTTELTKLLEKDHGQTRKSVRISSVTNSPILPCHSKKVDPILKIDLTDNEDDLLEAPDKIIVAKQIEQKLPEEDKTVKIKYAKNNEEICLEGQWPNLQVILQDVMHIIHKDRTPSKIGDVAKSTAEATLPDIATGKSKMADAEEKKPDDETDIHRKIDELENTILKETLEIDKLIEDQEDKQSKTKMSLRGRPKKRDLPLPTAKGNATPEPRPRRAKRSSPFDNKAEDNEIIVNESKLLLMDAETGGDGEGRRSTGGRKAVSAKEIKKNVPDVASEDMVQDDSEILYKFPSPEPEEVNTRKTVKNRNYNPTVKIMRLQIVSPESSQGYQDSDHGPVCDIQKRKKVLPSRNQRKKSYDIHTDASDECSQSMPPQLKGDDTNIAKENASLATEAYRSESYQLLMPSSKRDSGALCKIRDASSCTNEVDSMADTNSLHLSPASQRVNSGSNKSSSSISININGDVASSSSVSLPLSPELSIVENISIDKNEIGRGDHPTLNEMEPDVVSLSMACDNFDLSLIDVSMPLMQQECRIRMSEPKNKKELTYNTNQSDSQSMKSNGSAIDTHGTEIGFTVTESFLDKLDTVNIEDNPSFLNALDDKLKNLLLESAKKSKVKKLSDDKENMSVDELKVNVTKNTKKDKQKKRSSTPRKRNIRKSQPNLVDGIIEEEIMEHCYSGRKSCPPVITTVSNEAMSFLNKNTKSKSPEFVTKRKPKKIKEILKVKILRPKPKKSNKSKNGRESKLSVRTDSGINDTTHSVISPNMSVDLIHNHSETCLQTSECFDNPSIQILSPSKSIISISTSSLGSDCVSDEESIWSRENVGLPPETYSADARDASPVLNVPITLTETSPTETYHTPPASVSSLNSLITEDFSDEIPTPAQKTDWFLVSDEEASNTLSNLEPAKNIMNNTSYDAYLKRLFPVTCSVPNLSTITEASKDTDSNGGQAIATNSQTVTVINTPSDSEDFLSCL